MGIVIWYKVEFQEIRPLGPPFPLTISNDVYNARYITDAEITLTMSAGEIAGTFEIKFTNLPADVAAQLLQKARPTSFQRIATQVIQSAQPASFKGAATQVMERARPKPSSLLAEIHLGYFDDFARFRRSNAVMLGAIRSVKNEPNDDGLLETTVKGLEITGYRLKMSEKSYSNPGEIAADVLVRQIAKAAGVTVDPDSTLSKKLKNFTLKTGNGLTALSKVAENAGAALVVGDGQIYIGHPSLGSSRPAVLFETQLNIVEMAEEVDNDQVEDINQSVTLTALGDPQLRVRQKALLVKDPRGVPDTYLITSVTHSFSTTQSGYTCEVTLGKDIS